MRDMATILDGFGCILLNNLWPGTDGKAMRMQDVFPDLYHKELQEEPVATGNGVQSADMEVYKAARLYHAYCFNQNRNRKGTS